MDLNFRLGFVFRNSVPLEGWQKTFQSCKIPECLDFIDCMMVLPFALRKFNAKNILDAFTHVSDIFKRAPGRKIGFRDPGPENKVEYSCKPLYVNSGPPPSTEFLLTHPLLQKALRAPHYIQNPKRINHTVDGRD